MSGFGRSEIGRVEGQAVAVGSSRLAAVDVMKQ
jgi:hypothetical protein